MADQKILITIPWFAPAYKAGGPIRSVLGLLKSYTSDCRFYIFCSATDLNNEPLTGITKNEWVHFDERTSVWYASEKINSSLTEQAEKIKPDVLFIIGMFSRHFNLVPLFFVKAGQKILSPRGMLHPAALKQKRIKKMLFLVWLKLTGKARRITWHATDATEAGFIQELFGQVKIGIAGNFPSLIEPVETQTKEPGVLALVTVALISPMKDHLLVLDALMQCRSTITWNIYGPVKDMAYWQFCLNSIRLLPKNITVHYHGELNPAGLSEALSQNHVFIQPSKSENFGHAFTEAFSAGLPVITSMNTPWSDLAAGKAGHNAESTAASVAEAIEYFAGMTEQTYRLFRAGALNYAARISDAGALSLQYDPLFNPPNAS